jgi:hypothetical protein
MAMTERDIEDFLRVLQDSAELRERVRSVLLADDFLALPGLMRANTEAIAALTERMAVAETRLEGVEARLERVEARLEGVEARLEGVEARLEGVETGLESVKGELGNLNGQAFEDKFIRNVRSNLGPRFRKPRVLDIYADDLLDKLFAQSPLTGKETKDVATADLLVWARDTDAGIEVALVVEVSRRIGLGDVTRAHRRASLLARAGVSAVAVAAGASISPETAEAVRKQNVVVIVQQPEEDEPAA